MPGAVASRADREHHRHFDQDAHYGCERRARFRPEERYGRGNRKLEEIGCADQRPGAATECSTLSHLMRP
jgi:hypothetical protein